MDTMPQSEYRSLPSAMALQNIDRGLRPLNHCPTIPETLWGTCHERFLGDKKTLLKIVVLCKNDVSSQCYMPCVYNASYRLFRPRALARETLRLGFGEASMISVACSLQASVALRLTLPREVLPGYLRSHALPLYLT